MTDTLYIDSNEPQNVRTTVKLTIKDRDTDAKTEIKSLKTADFVYKDVAIERKEASDLASSIKDGRLKEQTLRMLEDFEHQYIIVEGNPYNLKHSNLHKHAFVGTMVSRSSEGIGIVYTPDVEATAYAVNKIISKHEEEGERKVQELKRTKADTEDVQVAMISCVKGISAEKAKKISEMFESIAQICSLAKHEPEKLRKEYLETVNGVGEKLSQRIVDSLMNHEQT
jgi:ERCC4-type nuclease